MKTFKRIVGAFLNMLVRLSISCFIVVAIYRGALYSYHFGYMVFSDAAKEAVPGRDITMSVEMSDKVMDVGQTLASRGLIEDARVFYVQERLSEYHEMIKPGVYTLNTSMKPSEILQTLAGGNEDIDEMLEEKSSDNLISGSSNTESLQGNDNEGGEGDNAPELQSDNNDDQVTGDQMESDSQQDIANPGNGMGAGAGL